MQIIRVDSHYYCRKQNKKTLRSFFFKQSLNVSNVLFNYFDIYMTKTHPNFISTKGTNERTNERLAIDIRCSLLSIWLILGVEKYTFLVSLYNNLSSNNLIWFCLLNFYLCRKKSLGSVSVSFSFLLAILYGLFGLSWLFRRRLAEMIDYYWIHVLLCY